MMFRLISIAALAATAAAAEPSLSSNIYDGIAASSEIGSRILSKSRQLANNNNNDGTFDMSWIPNYSLRFGGCYSMPTFEKDQGMKSQMLVKFKLCPSGSCSASCSGGDYVTTAQDFADAYTEGKMTATQYDCEMARETCEYYCQNKVDQYYSEDTCMSTCYSNAGVSGCDDANENDNGFNVQKYLECQKIKGADGNAYYVGPTCGNNGNAIYLAVFSDEACSTEVSSDIFSEAYGYDLPYTSESIVGTDCISCKEPSNNKNENDANDSDNVLDSCANVYYGAGKCEKNLASVSTTANSDGCSFIQNTLGAVAKSTSSHMSSGGGGGAAKAFAAIFFISTVGLGAYVYFLLTKAKRAGVKLHDGDSGLA